MLSFCIYKKGTRWEGFSFCVEICNVKNIILIFYLLIFVPAVLPEKAAAPFRVLWPGHRTGHPVNTGRLELQNLYYCWCSKQLETYCLSLIKPNTEKYSVNLAFNCDKYKERWSRFIIRFHHLIIVRLHDLLLDTIY